MGHWQTVQTLIRCCKMQHLIRICTVCFKDMKFRAEGNSHSSPFYQPTLRDNGPTSAVSVLISHILMLHLPLFIRILSGRFLDRNFSANVLTDFNDARSRWTKSTENAWKQILILRNDDKSLLCFKPKLADNIEIVIFFLIFFKIRLLILLFRDTPFNFQK